MFQPRRAGKKGALAKGAAKGSAKVTPLDEAVMRHTGAGHELFFVEIGASDGVTGDPLYKHVQTGALKRGLLVEPLPDLFELLTANYAGHADSVQLANVAIGSSNSTNVDMMRVPLDACQSLPKWVRGTSSLRPECTPLTGKNVSAALFSVIEPLIQTVSVQVCSLSTLLDRYNVGKVDLLQLDCEGMDWLILQQLDWERYQPWVINLEAVNLPLDELAACVSFLEAKGFHTVRYKYDLTAWRTNAIM
jgi:FkbM family methyltransferase